MGREVTFARDTADPAFLQATLLDLADRVSSDLRRKGYLGRTVVLRLRDSRFRTVSRQRTLPAPTNATQVVYAMALTLLTELHGPGRPLRLVGLTLSGLTEAGQIALDDGSNHSGACDDAVDRVRARYGPQALRRAGCGSAFDGGQPPTAAGEEPESDGD